METVNEITLSNLELSRFFFAIVLLLLLSHSFGYFFQKFKLPRVVGEITGGVLLGPTLLGNISPESYNWIFNGFESEGKLLSIISWIGLILLMFISGFEVQKSFDKSDKRIITALLIGSTILPFGAGILAPFLFDFSPFIGFKNNTLALSIVIAVAFTVTSIPVISKIFMDLGILNTRFAKIILATATIHDVILWIAVAVATGLVSGKNLEISDILSTITITLLFFGISLLVMPKLIKSSSTFRINILIKSSVSGYSLLICFLFAAVASILDVNIVFGAFLAGIVIGSMPEDKFESVKKNIKEISLALFVPIYFAIVGLKIDLLHYFDWVFFLGFLLCSTFFIILGSVISARMVIKDWFSSFNLGVAMSARGGPGIVLATIAFDMGIINETFFVVLVSVAIVTSLITGYWFKIVLSKGWELMKE